MLNLDFFMFGVGDCNFGGEFGGEDSWFVFTFGVGVCNFGGEFDGEES